MTTNPDKYGGEARGSLTADRARELFDYTPDTGELVWRISPGRAISGAQAGAINVNGYRYVMLNKKSYKAHRIIFLIHHGYMPEYVDHIDRNRSNNKIENLRSVTKSQNCHNSGLRANNKSGFKGVCLYRRDNTWVAQIQIDKNKSCHIGYFKNPVLAARAYDIEAIKYCGKFAVTNASLGLFDEFNARGGVMTPDHDLIERLKAERDELRAMLEAAPEW